MREEKNRAGVVVLPHPLMSERQVVNRGLMKYACLGYARGVNCRGTLRTVQINQRIKT
jgi:hypothetical protein